MKSEKWKIRKQEVQIRGQLRMVWVASRGTHPNGIWFLEFDEALWYVNREIRISLLEPTC